MIGTILTQKIQTLSDPKLREIPHCLHSGAASAVATCAGGRHQRWEAGDVMGTIATLLDMNSCDPIVDSERKRTMKAYNLL